MKEPQKEYREDYEYSPLNRFIQEDWIKDGDLYKKIDVKIILDLDLTVNDLSIFLSISKQSSFEDYYQNISHKVITEICGVTQSNQPRSIQKLEEKGYIDVSHNEGTSNSYKVNVHPRQYLPLKLEQFDGLVRKSEYVKRLRGLILASGNDYLPIFKTCKKRCDGKLTREMYNQIKKVYYQSYEDDDYEYLDIMNYVRLSNN